MLKAQSVTGTGHEELRPAAAAAAELLKPAAGGLLPLDEPDVPASSTSESVLGIDALALSDTLLGAGRYAQVLQVCILTDVLGSL